MNLSSTGGSFLEQDVEKDSEVTVELMVNCCGPLVMSALGVRWEGCGSALLVMSALSVRWEGCGTSTMYLLSLD